MCAEFKSSSRSNVQDRYSNKYLQDSGEESEYSDNYLDIWEVNPSYRDIQPKSTIIKLVFLSIIMFFLLFLSYILFLNIYIYLIMTLLIVVFFIAAFHDNFFTFQNSPISMPNKIHPLDPFKNIQFWILEDDPATLLITNRKDLLTIATRIFEIEVLPENVHPTLNHFLKALNTNQIPFTYQVVNKPIIHLSEKSIKKKGINNWKKKYSNNIVGSFKISIYFSVYQIAKGVLTNHRLMNLIETVKSYSKGLKSLFYANFHHTKISLLTENDLINAIRTLFTGGKIDVVQKKEDHSKSRKFKFQNILKLSFITFISIYASLLLFFLNISWEWIIFAVSTIIISVMILCWKDIFFYFTNSYLDRRDQIILVNPFSNIQFYHLRDTIFLYINHELLIGLKSYNLGGAFYSYYSYSGKFFRALNANKIPFIYTLHTSATTLELFMKECEKFLNEKAKIELRRIFGDRILESSNKISEQRFPGAKYPEIEFKKWLQKRTGIWKTILTISCFSYKFTSFLSLDDFNEIEEELYTNSQNLSKDYEDNFLNYKLVQLKKNLLVSGFLNECLKNNVYRANGTHLSYIHFQGKPLIELIKIVNEFKKGVETRIAAEFNTPLHLENFITIGDTINTEFLEEEVPLGFKFSQINQLLITNGTKENRELLSMKLVSELIKKNIPSIIFDFSGNWTKIIKYFEKSRYANDFLYFKLGSSFNVNLLHSEIEYDKNNPLYLNYFYDVFAMAFKEQKRNVDTLKEIILKNRDMSLTSIRFDLQMKQKWEKGQSYDNILSFFSDFIQQSVIFSDMLYEYEGKITPKEFLKDNRTIILDLSILKDLEQKVFVAFVLLSKIIHFINHSSEYFEKILVIPHADLFFDSYYLDTNFGNYLNYGKVDKFLDPLIQKNFGIILSANQIRYFHPNIFNYVEDIITFKAKDKRDLAVLKNQMNLQELHGTGYYSSKRNNTYQIEYLMNMDYNEILVKRSDIYQPFPGIIKFDGLTEISEMNYYEIIEYMKNQGYNLKLAEAKILEKAKNTLFDKDLGIYSEFKDEIKDFLMGIKKVDKIALNKPQINKALEKFIYPKASKKTKNKKQLIEIRENIFTLLLKHGYLKTKARRTAGGPEAMFTCYVVGDQFQKALDDYHESIPDYKKKISVKPIKINNSEEIKTLIQEKAQNKEIDQEKVRDLLIRLGSETLWNIFQMYDNLNRKDYNEVLKIGSQVVRTFILDFHRHFNQQFGDISARFGKLGSLIDYLYENKSFPFSKAEIRSYLEQTELICKSKSEPNHNSKVEELYDLISNFHKQLMNFIGKI